MTKKLLFVKLMVFLILFFTCPSLCISNIMDQSSPSLNHILKADLLLLPDNHTIQMRFTSTVNLNSATVQIIFPEDIENISSNTFWTGSLLVNNEVILDNSIRVLKAPTKIKAVVFAVLATGEKISKVVYLVFQYQNEKLIAYSSQDVSLSSLNKRSSTQVNSEFELLNQVSTKTIINTFKNYSSDSISISGEIKYLDVKGLLQPLSSSDIWLVQISGLKKNVLKISSTNEHGDFLFKLPIDSASISSKYYLTVLTKSTTTNNSLEIVNAQVINQFTKTVYSASSDVFNISASILLDLIITGGVDNGAFESFQHLLAGIELSSKYLNFKPKSAVMIWPSHTTSTFGDTINIVQGDRGDRDVILHEYAHMLDAKYNISTLPGGDHYYDQNLSNHYDLEYAKKLAWAEGWADFFAVALQYEQTGDMYYDDTEDVNIHVNLNGPIKNPGTDCEAAVANILWDIFDNDYVFEPFDQLTLSVIEIWNLVTTNKRFSNIEGIDHFWKKNRGFDYPSFYNIYSKYTSQVTTNFVSQNKNNEGISLKCYPNPFNSFLTIEYTLPVDGSLEIEILNSLGQRIKKLVFEEMKATTAYKTTWDGKNEYGNNVSSGIYFIHYKNLTDQKLLKISLLK